MTFRASELFSEFSPLVFTPDPHSTKSIAYLNVLFRKGSISKPNTEDWNILENGNLSL